MEVMIVYIIAFVLLIFWVNWRNKKIADLIKSDLKAKNFSDVKVSKILLSKPKAFHVEFRNLDEKIQTHRVILHYKGVAKSLALFWEGENPPNVDISEYKSGYSLYMDWLDRKFPQN